MYGKIARSAILAWLINTATKIPTTTAIVKPINATLVLIHSDSRIVRKLSQSRKPTSITWWGGRRRKRRRSSSMTYEMKYQIPTMSSPSTMGGSATAIACRHRWRFDCCLTTVAGVSASLSG